MDSAAGAGNVTTGDSLPVLGNNPAQRDAVVQRQARDWTMVDASCMSNVYHAHSVCADGCDTPLLHQVVPVGQFNHIVGQQCDLGANISVTNVKTMLTDCQALAHPINLSGADARSTAMMCSHRGTFPFRLDDGDVIPIPMFFCEHVSATLLSPQLICEHSQVFHTFDVVCRDRDDPHVRFYTQDAVAYKRASMVRMNDLFFFSTMYSARRHVAHTVNGALSYELWHQRLGHPGHRQMVQLPKHSIGLPSSVAQERHPLHSCDTCLDAHAQRQPRGGTSNVDHLLNGSRFHLDFGYMRASSAQYHKVKHMPPVVASFDGCTAYLVIVDAVSRYTWVFPTDGKRAPVALVQEHLQRFGLKAGYRALRVDHGGELFTSKEFARMVRDAGYVLEPTGSGVHHRNGKVERLNRVLAVMVRSMLYGAGLEPKFWSAAVVHSAYIRNRMWHSAIGRTPYEALNGTKPDIAHLRVFGALVTVRKPDKPTRKLDVHTYRGVFLGFLGDGVNIRYFDTTSNTVKIGGSVVFDEAHFMSDKRPPSAQLLFELGAGLLNVDDGSVSVKDDEGNEVSANVPPACQPTLVRDKAPRTCQDATVVPLPLREGLIMPTGASAAAVSTDVSVRDVMLLDLSSHPFETAFDVDIPLFGQHPQLGIIWNTDNSRGRLRLLDIPSGHRARRIPQWRSRLRHAYLLAVNGVEVYNVRGLEQAVSMARADGNPHAVMTFAFDAVRNTLSEKGLIQLYFDQWRDIRDLCRRAKQMQQNDGVHDTRTALKLTRRTLRKQDDWELWRQSEHKQLQQYADQGMFGTPVAARPGDQVFHWVWVYVLKQNPTETRRKARAVCDGSPRAGKAVITGHTFTATPDATDFRLFLAIAAMENKCVYGADVSNAFAEAPCGAQKYFMHVDQPYSDWWESQGNSPIPQGHVIPIQKNLQGHPEAPRQWARHIDAQLQRMGFVPTTHAPCLYRARYQGQDVLFLRQVDDFAIACATEDTYARICNELDSFLFVPMKRFGVLRHFNGTDLIQTSTHISMHNGTYLSKVFERHAWRDMHGVRTPMAVDNSHIKMLDGETPLDAKGLRDAQQNFGSYRAAIGELIWPMVTCRPDIAFPVVKLAQFSAAPGLAHFAAVKRVFRYLFATREQGITFHRTKVVAYLPHVAVPLRVSEPHDARHVHPDEDPSVVYGYADSDWASDSRHRRSVSSMAFKLAGGAVAWKARVQPTVAMSSTEAELLCASDAGRMALCLRSTLDELGVLQSHATVLYEDNRGALMIANAGQPSRRTRHVEIRHFAIQQWVENAMVVFRDIDSAVNAGDIGTKQTTPPLFVRHWDNLSGRNVPPWSAALAPAHV